MNRPEDRTQNEPEISSMLRQLVAAIVDNPGPIEVHCLRSAEGLRFTVEVASEDLDRLRGPASRTAESLAVIVRAAGLKAGDRCQLCFQETCARPNQDAESASKAVAK